MRALVTGAAGSIGSELVRQLSETCTVCLFDNNEVGIVDLVEELTHLGKDVAGYVGDIRNNERISWAIENFGPDIIYHAAAYKCVNAMEAAPREAIDTNIIGTDNVISAAKKFGVKKLVFISTDKAVSMNSVMGASKKFGEILTRNAGYNVVRFGNVMGSRGSVIPFWKNQIARGQPITITDVRCERFFMSIEDAVGLVIEAGKEGRPGETYILNMGKPINIKDLAMKVIKECGKKDNYPMITIGLRPGETLTERLTTEEEEKRLEVRGKFYVIT